MELNIPKKKNKANQAGKAVEEALAAFMRAIGWEFEQQVPVGPSIFRYALVVDFVVKNLREYPRGLILESKWQGRPGTVDEKFPCLQQNLQTCAIPSIVIASGGGYRRGALEWLRAQCDGEHLLAVYSLDQFFKWALRSEKREDVEDSRDSNHAAGPDSIP